MGAIAILSVSALGQRLSGGSPGQLGGDVQIASKDQPGAHPYQAPNEIQHILQLCLNERANYLIELAINENNQDTVGKLVRANDSVMLSLQRPDEQQHTIVDVWQVDKWKPNDADWAQVSRTPSLVKELLEVDPAICQKAGLREKEIWDQIISPLHAVEHRLLEDPAFRNLSPQEQQDAVAAEMRKLPQKKPVDRMADAVVVWNQLLNYTRGLLSGKQLQEFDAFIARHEQAMNAAAVGLRIPPPGR